ncbi:helix-turn-helix domain-containing protein [Aeromicrobium sp. UC242_57]|uniref:helix-turn-helix domain-containing protein n=1 Tax=Aeromicrobium sp. UC242_57 TaxID=3374624 RepID=UPI0037B5F231
MSNSIFFEPGRLRQAREVALLNKKELAEASGVSPAAIGQYEAGIATPRSDTLVRIASALDVPVEFFEPGRPLQGLDTSETYFESLRATTSKQRNGATSFAEQVWELSHALETHVRFPLIELPDIHGDPDVTYTPEAAAQATRTMWGLGTEPIGHLVAQLESRGIICCLAPKTPAGVPRIDAYSTLKFPRPLMVLTADRADDILRHRFSAARQLGHLVLHHGVASGETWLEREADSFAAEFLTPASKLRGRASPTACISRTCTTSANGGGSLSRASSTGAENLASTLRALPAAGTSDLRRYLRPRGRSASTTARSRRC